MTATPAQRRAWLARQADARAAAQAAGLTHKEHPMFAPAELTALAAELRTENPTLSEDQALDAAAALLPGLDDWAAEYEIDRVDDWLALAIFARQWDQAAHVYVAH
jgi:hypothetical protein